MTESDQVLELLRRLDAKLDRLATEQRSQGHTLQILLNELRELRHTVERT